MNNIKNKINHLLLLIILIIISTNIFAQFKPSDISGLQLWLRADTNLTFNGTTISAWKDCSGNNLSFTQASASSQPIQTLNKINGKAVITFDGINDFLSGGNVLNFGTNSYTVFIVGKNKVGLYIGKRSGPGQRCYIDYISSNQFRSVFETPTNYTLYMPYPNHIYYDKIYCNINRDNFIHSFTLNDSLLKTGGTNAYNYNAPVRCLIGARNNDPDNGQEAGSYLNGEIAEIIVFFKNLTPAELNNINSYIRSKYYPVFQPMADINITNGFCDTTLQASPNFYKYLWSTGDTTSTIQVNQSGSYWVKATNHFGTSYYDTVNVSYLQPALSNKTICDGSSTVLNANMGSGFTYTWSNGANTPQVTISAIGKYNVTITDAHACTFVSDSIKIDTAYAKFNYNSSCVNNPVTFNNLSVLPSGETTSQIIWNFGDGQTNNIDFNPIHTYTTGGIHSISLTIITASACTLSYTKNIDIVSTPPPVQGFSLIAPINCMLTEAKNILFKWSNAENVAYYNLEIASDSLFTTIVSQFDLLTDTVKTVTFADYGYYYWRIKAFNNCLNYSSSTTNKFCIFHPIMFSGAELWIKADSNITATSGKVSSWGNLISGKNYTFTQADVTTQPQKINAAINGYPSTRFDGVNDMLNGGNIINPGSSSITYFIIGKNSNGPYFAKRDGNGSKWYYDYTNSNEMKRSVYEPSNTSYSTFKLGYTHNLFELNVVSINRTYYKHNLEVNDTLLNTSDIDPSASSFSNSVRFLLGGLNNDSDNGQDAYLNGEIAEMIIYFSALDSTQIATVKQYLYEKYGQKQVYLGPDITIPYGFCDTTLNAGGRFIEYLWSTGETTSSIQVNNGGAYWVQVKDPFGFVSSDTIIINKPKVTLNDTTICLYDSAPLNINLGTHYSYLWSTSETTESINTSTIGDIWFKVSDTLGCQYIDTLTISADSFEVTASLGPDRNFCHGDTLRLNPGELAGNTYLWNNASTLPYRVIQYPGGNYHVTATNTRGCIARDTVNLTIIGYAPIVDFIAPSGCLNYTTAFIDNSSVSPIGTISSRIWDFGDDSTYTGLNPIHQYADTGKYNVSLIITTSAGCTRSLNKEVQVYPLPRAYFNPTNGCTNDTIKFSDMSVANYGALTNWNWNFGNSNTSIVQNAAQSYNTIGNYNVQLIVTTDYGCKDTITRIVKIKQSPFIDFDYTSVCFGLPVTFWEISDAPNYHPIDAWAWNFNDGSLVDSTKNPIHFFSAPGTYPVSLTLHSLSGCEVSKVKNVKVNAIPVAEFYTNNLCVGQPLIIADSSKVNQDSIVSWKWSIENNGNYFTQNPTISIADTGTYDIKLLVTSSGNCSDSTMKTVVINPVPNADFDYTPTYGTAPLIVYFTNTTTGGNNYTWDFGDSTALAYTSNSSYTYNENGTYYIKLLVENNYGCFDSIIQTLSIKPSLLDISVIGVTKIQENGKVRLKVDLANIGTRPIYNFDIQAEAEGSTAIIETWTGTLESGQFLSYIFNSAFAVSESNSPEYICVNVKNPNSQIDENPTNNDFCLLLGTEFKMLDIYPNPTTDFLNVEYIIPLKDNVKIELFDNAGKTISTIQENNLDKGFHKKSINTSALRKGTYAVKVSYRDKTEVKIFVKK
ncbi:MAG: PKD domain-containing protein [Bacteroidota bacterium]